MSSNLSLRAMSTGLLRLGIGIGVVLLTPGGLAGQLSLEYRGSLSLPTNTVDQHGIPFTVTGMSGLSWLGGSQYLAVMDNSDKLVRIDLRPACDGGLRSATIVGGISLSESRDFEGIAFTDAARDSVFLSEEGTPSIREYSLSTGLLLQTVALHPVYTTPGHQVPIFGLESLTRRRDGQELYTANEEALTVDGPVSTSSAGTVVRIQHFAPQGVGFDFDWQAAYRTRPIHGSSIPGSRSGLVDLVVLPDGGLLSLERSLAFHLGGLYSNAIFEVDTSQATDVSRPPFDTGLIGQSYTLAGKRLLWESQIDVPMNFEGLALGSRLPNGHHMLLGIVDDGDPLSSNTIAAFELSGAIGGTSEVDLLLLSGPGTARVGERVRYDLDGAPVRVPYQLLASFRLTGFIFRNHVFDLGPPIEVLTAGRTDGNGRASWQSSPLPNKVAGRSVYVEAGASFGCLLADSNALRLDVL